MPATAQRYAAARTNEGLVIRNVVVAVAGDTGRGFDLTHENFSAFVETFNERRTRGHIGAYARIGSHDGPRIGELTALHVHGDNLVADFLIDKQYDADGTVAARIEADSITDLSATFILAKGDSALIDVSILDSAFGQLHRKLPPLLIDVKQEFGVDGAVVTLALKPYRELAMADNDKTNKDEDALSKIMGKLDSMESRLKKLEQDDDEDDKKAMSLTGDDEVERLAQSKVGKALQQLEAEKAEFQLRTFVTRLEAQAGGATERQRDLWRKRLEEVPADARQYRFEAMEAEIKNRRVSTPLEAEPAYVRTSVEKQLEEETRATLSALGVKDEALVSKLSRLYQNDVTTLNLR